MQQESANFSEAFGVDTLPEWLCPSCHRGRLVMDPTSLNKRPTAKSLQNGPENYDPEDDTYHFSALLKCNLNSCRESAFVVGETVGAVEWDDQNGYHEYFQILRPTFIQPAPLVFLPPKKTPAEVVSAISTASSLIWTSTGAACNALRTALERIMDDVGIARQGVSGAGKAYELKLHQRIQALGAKHTQISALLMAAKLVGNEGSHEGDVSRADALDAFGFVEGVVTYLYDDSMQTIRAQAKQVVQARQTAKKAAKKAVKKAVKKAAPKADKKAAPKAPRKAAPPGESA
ncbi:DUF4145 domain-containing protein [Achromobacter spanius]|uniref:DUF4145 domain-containing protein n=1 Tax=Achromobacter spanius TaxID=217203 RepID=UPI003A8F8BA1